MKFMPLGSINYTGLDGASVLIGPLFRTAGELLHKFTN